MRCDVSDEDEIERVFDSIASEYGRLDILVNNAGLSEPLQATIRQSSADWQRTIDVNLRGPFLCSREAAKPMIANRSGSIINICSIAGMTGMPASNAYGVSKAGLVMLTSTLSLDFARFGIRVNGVVPGMIDAAMMREVAKKPDELEPIERRIPMKRIGKPDEIGHAVAFLCSDLASYITGQVLSVDGGWLAFGGIDAPP